MAKVNYRKDFFSENKYGEDFYIVNIEYNGIIRKFLPVSQSQMENVCNTLSERIEKVVGNNELISSFLWRGGFSVHDYVIKAMEKRGIRLYDSFPILASSYSVDNKRREVSVEIPDDLIETISMDFRGDVVHLVLDDILDSKLSIGKYIGMLYERTALNFPRSLVATPFHKSMTNESSDYYVYDGDYIVRVDFDGGKERIYGKVSVLDVPSDVWIMMAHELVSVNPFTNHPKGKEDRKVIEEINRILVGDEITDIIYGHKKDYSTKLGKAFLDAVEFSRNIISNDYKYIVSINNFDGMVVKEVLDFFGSKNVFHTVSVKSRQKGKYYNMMEAIRKIEFNISHNPRKRHIVYLIGEEKEIYKDIMKEKMGRNYDVLEFYL